MLSERMRAMVLHSLKTALRLEERATPEPQAGEKLTVPPADLSASLAQPLYGDDYFYWTMSDGGGAFGTDMPPFRNDLSEGEIWKVLIFMRAAFAESAETPAARAAPR